MKPSWWRSTSRWTPIRTVPPSWLPVWAVILGLGLCNVSDALAAQEGELAERRKGKVITVQGMIDSATKNRVIQSAKAAVNEGVDILIFDLQVGPSDFGPCYDLAKAVTALRLRRTVAFVSRPLRGHALLVAFACDETVLAPGTRIGDASDDGAYELSAPVVAAYGEIAQLKGRNPVLVQGMADKELRLMRVRTPDNTVQYLPEAEVEAKPKDFFREKRPFKERGVLLMLDAEQAKATGLVQLVTPNLRDLAGFYGLPESTVVAQGNLEVANHPTLMRLDGRISGQTEEFVQRRLIQASSKGTNLIFVELDTSSGDAESASRVGQRLKEWRNAAPNERKVIGWVPKQATGPGIFILFGCDEILLSATATIGGFQNEKFEANEYRALASGAVELAKSNRIPEAFVRGFVDPTVAVYQVRNKTNGLIGYRTAEELAQPEVAEIWVKERAGALKEADSVFSVDGKRAVALDIAVATADSLEELTAPYSIKPDELYLLQASWVDKTIDYLRSPACTSLLIIGGIFCLYLELQIPGFGVAGVLSIICFSLFFWARFLGETANSLEIVLFAIGVLLLAIELFLTPGFAFPGIAGILLILTSLVLASQSFIIPTTPAERQQFLGNITTVAVSLMVVFGFVVAFARAFPRLPILNRIILSPDDETMLAEERELATFAPVTPYDRLLGREGVADTPLRPVGRMRLGEQIYEVESLGEFIQTGEPVEVVEVYPNRIVVRRVTPA